MNHLLLRISHVMGLTLGIICLCSQLVAQKSQEFSIYFDYNQYLLRPEAIVQLDALVDSLSNAGQYEIKLSGHTDGEGMYDYTQTLSERRAWAVYRYLVRQKMDNGRIAIVSLGERQPASPDTTAKGRARNRRVDVMATYSPLPEQEMTGDEKVFPSDRQLAEDSYVYNRVFTGSNGSRVRFREGAFLPLDDEAVHIEVLDYIDSYAMMLAGISSVDTGGRCLESVGMVSFTAYNGVGGEEIQPKGAAPLMIEWPGETFDSTFQLYITSTKASQRQQLYDSPVFKGDRDNYSAYLQQSGKFTLVRHLQKLPLHASPPSIKVSGFEEVRIFIVDDGKQSWNALSLEKKNLYRNLEGCDCGGQNPRVIAFAKKNQQNYKAEIPLLQLKYTVSKNQYSLSKKYFKKNHQD